MKEYTELLAETSIDTIKYCPECECDSEEEPDFCPDCGTKILDRSPEINVDVEIEGQGSRCMTLAELFGAAKREGLI